MSIPEVIILLLFLSGAVLMAERMRLSVHSKKRINLGFCETGTSKTIGDREVQEDEFAIAETEEGLMAVLADGMGKHYGGRIASRTAVDVFQDLFEDRNAFYNPQYSFRRAFQAANREILNQLEENQGSASVGAVLIRDRSVPAIPLACWQSRSMKRGS